jgi:taurine dioxygenase
MLATKLNVIPATTALGAEIAGLDISRPLDDETFAQIWKTFNERGVLFFRNQRLDGHQFLAFARRFGTLTGSTLAEEQMGGSPLGEIRKNEEDSTNIGGRWHTDGSFRSDPDMGAMLVARTVPSAGGDTMWAGLGAAFDALSDGLKATLRGLRGVFRKDESDRDAHGRMGWPDADKDAGWQAVHPIVGRHPETDREILYCDPKYTVRFDGWSRDESLPLLRFLAGHITQPEFTCRFRWEVGSVAVWDNRQCLHLAVNDYHGQQRVMHRVVIEGPFLQ